jgi:hypothetical protein
MTSTLTVDTIQGSTNADNVKLPKGCIVQVEQFLQTGAAGDFTGQSLATIQSATFTDVMNKSITTKFANSKIFVQIGIAGYTGTSGNGLRANARLLRNTTEINYDQYAFYGYSSVIYRYQSNVIDAPAAAAGTVLNYKLQMRKSGGENFGIGYADSAGRTEATLTLMEIVE